MQRTKRFLPVWQRQHLLILIIFILLVILVLKHCCNHQFPKNFGFASVSCTNRSGILRYITYVPRGGLGNRLFEYASTYGLSRHFGLQLVIRDDNLERVFGSSLTATRASTLGTSDHDQGSQTNIHWFDEFEAYGSSFDRDMVERLEVLLRTTMNYCEERVGIRLHGYLQSFRYFEKYLPEIRAQFSFTGNQLDAATAFVEAVRNRNTSAYSVLSNTRFDWDRFSGTNSNDTSSVRQQSHDAMKPLNVQQGGDSLAVKINDYREQRKRMEINRATQRNVVVGVHVRRGDMVNNMQMVSAGYQTADYRYLLNATRYFRRMFAERGASVRFFVSSNDVPWTQEYFPFRRDAVFSGADTQSGLPAYFMEHAATTVKDLLILAHCDALILTVGSYGFWAAILGNAYKPITYYARPYRSGSLIELAHNYTVSDYYPPHWLGMTG